MFVPSGMTRKIASKVNNFNQQGCNHGKNLDATAPMVGRIWPPPPPMVGIGLRYRISSFSFRGNYSFLNLEIQRLQYIRPKVTVHKCAETI